MHRLLPRYILLLLMNGRPPEPAFTALPEGYASFAMNIASPKLKNRYRSRTRLPVGGQDVLPACKGGRPASKGALRQVKIGDESVHGPEAVAGMKDVRPLAPWTEAAVLPPPETPGSGRRWCPRRQSGPPLPGCIQQVRRLLREHTQLAVHMVLRHLLRLHRPEGAQTHWRVTKASLIPFCRILSSSSRVSAVPLWGPLPNPGTGSTPSGSAPGPGAPPEYTAAAAFYPGAPESPEKFPDNETAPPGFRPPAPGSPWR